MIIQRKPKRPRMGVREIDPAVFNQHRRFVRSHGCSVPGCQCTDIEFAHLRSAANAGTAIKPHDSFGISLCAAHHAEAHRIGHDTAAMRWHVDLWRIAAGFVSRTPDFNLRESFERLPAHLQGLLYPERLEAA